MKEESYTQNMIMCNGSVKKKRKKKKEFAKWPPMKPPRNISNSLKCFVQLKKSSRSEFHKRFKEVFLSFFFNEFVNRQKGKVEIH